MMDDRDDDPLLVQLARIRWRISALDGWRKEIDARVAILESRVSDLRFTDAVAEQLAAKLSAKRRLELTLMQKVGGGVFALMLVAIPTVIAKFA